MVLLFIDALILSFVLFAAFLVIRNAIRSSNQRKLEEALFRQQVAEDLAKQVDKLDPETVKLHEEKIRNKLNGLQ